MQPLRPLPANTEVTLDYGAATNLDLLASHGFILPANPQDRAPLPHPPLPLQDLTALEQAACIQVATAVPSTMPGGAQRSVANEARKKELSRAACSRLQSRCVAALGSLTAAAAAAAAPFTTSGGVAAVTQEGTWQQQQQQQPKCPPGQPPGLSPATALYRAWAAELRLRLRDPQGLGASSMTEDAASLLALQQQGQGSSWAAGEGRDRSRLRVHTRPEFRGCWYDLCMA